MGTLASTFDTYSYYRIVEGILIAPFLLYSLQLSIVIAYCHFYTLILTDASPVGSRRSCEVLAAITSRARAFDTSENISFTPHHRHHVTFAVRLTQRVLRRWRWTNCWRARRSTLSQVINRFEAISSPVASQWILWYDIISCLQPVIPDGRER